MSRASGTRDPYKTRAKTRKEEEVSFIELTEEEQAPNGFFVTDGGGLLPESFQEAYYFYSRSMAPAEWVQPFTAQEDLGNRATNATKFFSEIM